eukprot:TRINITY_DN7052_c0_g1_i1.p1 TRINITY_DN7052_c0_g1~~TRINITY_DN7052_c0_g1_i1.p1  ORF type:complete len:239 (+),score=23.35 TRINITY_DN7052_c0_g1_i1:56-772(+)
MTCPLPTAPYLDQKKTWPKSGKHVMAQAADEYIVVYQAFNDEIGAYAAENKKFKGAPGWLPKRMTWIKTDFLWMMYRSDWGRSMNQTKVLAIKLKRSVFESLLEQSIPSSFAPHLFESKKRWQEALKNSDIRLQWDPAKDLNGDKDGLRRAVQIGMRNQHAIDWASGDLFVDVIDVSDFVATVRELIDRGGENVEIPAEKRIILGVKARTQVNAAVDEDEEATKDEKNNAESDQEENK